MACAEVLIIGAGIGYGKAIQRSARYVYCLPAADRRPEASLWPRCCEKQASHSASSNETSALMPGRRDGPSLYSGLHHCSPHDSQD
jgi:hypothetical protein